MRKYFIVAALLCALCVPGSAWAQDDGSYQETVHATLTVTKPSSGLITGSAGEGNIINCGGANNDCSEQLNYTRTCFDSGRPQIPDDCDDGTPHEVTLTASGMPAGFEAQWTGCNPTAARECRVVVSANRTVSLVWRDAVAPSVSFVNPAARANGNTTFTAQASDGQTGIAHVRFDLPGLVFDDDQTGPTYQFRPNFSGYFEQGHSYTVTVRARDGADNISTDQHTFVFDASAALDSISTAPALTRCASPYDACARPRVATPPAFTFDPADDTVRIACLTEDVAVAGRELEELREGLPSLSCTQPIDSADAQPTWDGVYRTAIVVWDTGNLNSESYVYEWILDRRPPSITITSPAAGGFVTAPFTPAIAVGEGATPVCDVGSGPVACNATFDPAEGARVLTVTATDAVGNSRTVTRSFTYDKTAPQASITSGPAEGALIRTRSVAFGFTTGDAVGPVTRECKVDQGDFGPCGTADGHAIDNLSPGIHRFTLRVTDAAGHVTQVTRQFVTDDPLPEPGSGGGANVGTGDGGGTGGGGGGADGGAGGGSSPGGEAETPRPLTALGRIAPRWSVRTGQTTVRKLTLSGLIRGATVEVTCKGRGCFRGTSKFTARRSKLDLTTLFRKRKLAAGARIEIRIAQPGRVTKVFRYTTQKGKKKPKVKTLCLPAGSSRPAAC